MAVLVAGCATHKSQSEAPYVGTWYAQGRDPSLTWRLSENGGYGEGTGFVTPSTDQGSWKAEKGELVITKKGDGQQRVKAKVVGDTMTVDEPGGPLIFMRVAH
jgi:hypothetical protein